MKLTSTHTAEITRKDVEHESEMRHHHLWIERKGARYINPDHFDGAGFPYSREYAVWDCACGEATHRPAEHEPNIQDRFWRRWLWVIAVAWILNAAFLAVTGHLTMWLFFPAGLISVPWLVPAVFFVLVFPSLRVFDHLRGQR